MKRLLLSLFFFSLWGYPLLAEEGYRDVEEKSSLSIKTPSLAERKTAKIRLDNGIEAYLISDPQADQSAAALSVHAGSWSDPDDAVGLAHFCEHLLFMGTEKYPEEAGYHRFVKEQGGWSNAYTTSDHTAYMFTTKNEAFREAVDRFSWFFKAPLFNPSGVDRELKAIQSEYTTHLEKDISRRIHVFKQLTEPGHPYSRFTIGNKETLQDIPPERVRQWYESHYSANLMHLVLYSPLSIEELKKVAVEDFGAIKNKHFSATEPPAPILDPEHHGKTLHIAPVKDTRSLSVMWELPAQFARRLDDRPGQLIAFILGHEGKKSLLDALKKENLAEGLSAGGYDMSDNSYFFDINVQLTEKGLDHTDRILSLLFSAIDRLKVEGVPHYIFKEEQTMDRIRYAYQEREDAFKMVSEHARAMLFEPLETYPEKTLVLQEFNEPLVKEFIEQLRPEKSLYVLTAQPELTGTHLDKKEPWLGAEYSLRPIDSQLIASLEEARAQEEVQIPPPNPFVPKSMKLVEAGMFPTASSGLLIRPELFIDDASQGKVYFASDNRYKVPEVYWILNIKTPFVDLEKPETIVLADLYTRAVAEALNTYTYPASLAGLSFGVARGDDGIAISVNGYSENALTLLDTILKTMRSVSPTEEQFETYKSSLVRAYRNFRKESPLAIGNEMMQSIIYRNFVTAHDKAKAITTVSYSDFLRYTQTLFSQSYLEAMLFGNMTRNDAEKIWEEYRSVLAENSYPLFQHPKPEVIILPEDKGPFYLELPAEQTGNATLLAVQNGPYTFESRAAQQTLGKLLEEPFFSQLRTKQQTGYIVFSSAQEIERQLFILFAVQSATHDTRDLLARYEQFIEGFLSQLESDPAMKKRFDTVKSSLITQLSQPPKNMQEMAATLNLLAFDYEGDFDFLDKRIRSFEELSYEPFTLQAKEYLGRENRRRFATLIRGNTEEGTLRYQRAKTPTKLRKSSSFVTASSVE